MARSINHHPEKQPEVLILSGWQDDWFAYSTSSIVVALLNTFNDGITAPSANKFTHISPTTAAAVEEELGNQVDLILDGGDCEVEFGINYFRYVR